MPPIENPDDHPNSRKVDLACVGLSILSVICQLFAYRLLWPRPSAMNGPMGMLVYEIGATIALIAVAGISLSIFLLMLYLGVRWFIGQGLALLNFAIAIIASTL